MEVHPVSQPPPRLLDRMRAELRLQHYSLRTEQSYLDWTQRYLLSHGQRHPQELGAEAVRDFLSHRASAACRRHAGSGQGGAAVSVPRGVEDRFAVAEGSGGGESGAAPAGGADRDRSTAAGAGDFCSHVLCLDD